MRVYCLIFFFLISCLSGICQEPDIFDVNTRICNHARGTSGTQQIEYYQYPSMAKYDQDFLRLDVLAEPGSRALSGNVFMKCHAVTNLDTFIIELRSTMTADSCFINGSRKNATQSADHISIPLTSSLTAGSSFEIQIFYHGTASSNAIYTGTTNGMSFTASLSESYQAREWYPAKQILTDKLDSLEVWVTTSIGNRAGSCGLLQDSTDVAGGKRQFKWKTRHPVNYYMPSIAVGNYMDYRNYAKPSAIFPDSIMVQHYISGASGYLGSVKTNLDKTPRFIELYSDLFGLYPFHDEKYGHCLANIGGGMEHQTMSTMANFGSTLIAHELGHQWWGDHVTCASWNHIWLNEGFSTYCEYLAMEKLPALFTTTTAFNYMQGIHSSAMSAPGGSVYVPDADIYNENRIFSSRLSYNKGAAIVHNLRFEMESDTAFFRSLQNFQQQFKDSTATAIDFKSVAEAACGKSLTDFFNQWYYGEGYPTFNITYFKQGLDTLLLLVEETTSSPSITPFFKGLLQLKVNSGTGDTTVVVNLQNNNQQFRIPYTKTPSGIVVDPNNWMLNQTGIIINGGTVPVSFTGISAAISSDCVTTVSWTVANETGGLQYTVEQSTDGIQFSDVITIPGSNRRNYSYSFRLSSPGQHIFRIRMTQPDGNMFYSYMATVNNSCALDFSVKSNPNPVRSQMNLLIRMPSDGSCSIQIYNSQGALMHNEERVLGIGPNNIFLDLAGFPSGHYSLRVAGPSGTAVNRFIKL